MLAGEGYSRGNSGPRALAHAPAGVRPGPASDRAAERRAATGVRSTPAWFRAVDASQRALRQPLPILSDLAVGAGAVAASAQSGRAGLVAGAALLVAGLLFGVWKRRSTVQAQGVAWYLRRIAPQVACAAVVLCLYPGLSGRQAAMAAAVAFIGLTVFEMAQWVVVGAARRRGIGLRRTLVIGPERHVAGAEYRIHLYPEAGLVCAHSHVTSARTGEMAAQELIESLVLDHAIDHIVCTGADGASETLCRDVIRLAPSRVDVTVVQSAPVAGASLTRLGDLAVVCLAPPSWGTELCKRLLDVSVSALLLAVLSPLLATTALAIRLGDPGPAIFRQRRTGRGNRCFTIFKFRSMVRDAEQLKPGLADRNVADGLLFKAENDPRITPVGALIRRFSIDELPQLINVLRGEMSLVGPRPLPNVFDEADIFARTRHEALPGITGLWQVKGANALSYEDMIDLDCAYVATRSLGLDLRILVQTIPAVLVRRSPY